MAAREVISLMSAEDPGDRPVTPPTPENLEDTGLSVEFVTDLVLRTMYVQGAQMGQDLMGKRIGDTAMLKLGEGEEEYRIEALASAV